jgi:hypothetical protein
MEESFTSVMGLIATIVEIRDAYTFIKRTPAGIPLAMQPGKAHRVQARHGDRRSGRRA